MSHALVIEPLGRRITVTEGQSILAAARQAGILLNATCGGEGSCGRCVVRITAGQVSEPSLGEEAELGPQRLNNGWRLACQAQVCGDVRIHIPAESLTTTQRTQTEGLSLPIRPEPAVQAVGPGGAHALGLAVDLGTTKLAAYLVDLADGRTLAAAGAMNPQIAYGEDVIARIAFASGQPQGSTQLRTAVLTELNDLVRRLCAQAGCAPQDIADAVVVGNTAMHHLFLGLPVEQLGVAPYAPAECAALDIPASQAGLTLAPHANLHLPPNIAGFVGADHVAMLLGSGMLEQPGIVLGMDIGTNTEISLLANGKHYACSTASGPAFEGAHIRHGMRAAPGAIEKVFIHQGQVRLQTIEGQAPLGLCGSGILDLVAQMRQAGIIDARGAFDKLNPHPRLRQGTHGWEFVVAAAEGERESEITFDRRDISEIQLAKAAIRSGLDILLQQAGVSEQAIDTVLLAGAFGTYLDVQSGIDIGMFPRLGLERFVQVGNAAGAGARMALLSVTMRQRGRKIAQQVHYVELTAEKNFTSLFSRSLRLE